VRRISGAEGAVPVQRLDVGTSGLVTFARRPELVAKWDRALSAATTRKIYVAAVRGVTPSKGAITRELREDGNSPSRRATASCASCPSTGGRTRSGGTSPR
jgi:23S rRNA (uracil1939-C5)-methyltransferase